MGYVIEYDHDCLAHDMYEWRYDDTSDKEGYVYE